MWAVGWLDQVWEHVCFLVDKPVRRYYQQSPFPRIDCSTVSRAMVFQRLFAFSELLRVLVYLLRNEKATTLN